MKPKLAIVIASLAAAAVIIYVAFGRTPSGPTPSGRTPSGPASTAGQELLRTMTEFKSRMCACKDTACAESVSGDMARWGETHKTLPPMSEPETRQLATINEEMSTCVARLLGVPPPVPSGGASHKRASPSDPGTAVEPQSPTTPTPGSGSN